LETLNCILTWAFLNANIIYSPSPLPDFKMALKDLTHRGPDDEGFFNFYRCNFRLFVILNKLLVG